MKTTAASQKFGLVAESLAMRELLEVAARAARAEATVLIEGETGTGKERLARFLHRGSQRASGPFHAVNCGALSASLLESELFGHRKGAFTGATRDHEGLFEAARGGTLFLDEVADTSTAMQVKLLRALQERTVRPVGGTADVDVDVRVVAATNRDLRRMVREGTFRKDLLYRLRVVPLQIPPLRERREDIVPLAQEFIAQYCAKNGCLGTAPLSADFLDLLMAYDWPGNARELENAIERVVVLAHGRDSVEIDDLPPEIRGGAEGWDVDDAQPAPLTLAEVERRHVLAVLRHQRGNRRATARALGIAENTLWRKLKRYGDGAAAAPD